MNVREYYEHALAERGYQPDEAQLQAVERLQRYYDEWVRFKALRSNALKKLLNRLDVPRGVYLWGGVGRGKSFLMDAFYATVPVVRKTRLHFHEFMRGVHRELEEVKGTQDPLDEVARRLARRYRLICFDEFHVSDVADAMILYRLLLKLFEHGTSFVMTSNYEPSTLYPDGLHRDRILPAIALIQGRMDVLNVDAGIDYRRRSLEQVQCYHTPLDAQAARRWNTHSRSCPTPRRRIRCCISSIAKSAPRRWPARSCGSTSPRCAAARAPRTTTWSWPTGSMR
ncbi:ATPase [Bordetella pertussis]|nr:ATPase [Bordetella pertussis]